MVGVELWRSGVLYIEVGVELLEYSLSWSIVYPGELFILEYSLSWCIVYSGEKFILDSFSPGE